MDDCGLAAHADRVPEADLRQAQKMAVVGRLLTGVAHDFNNVLTAILGFASLALDAGASPTVEGYLRDILHAGECATALARQLLSFSRPEGVVRGAVDLSEVVSSIEPLLRRLLGPSIHLRLELADRGRVWADRGQMMQVVVNLVVNARDAMPDGGTVSIRVARTNVGDANIQDHCAVERGCQVSLAVSDTGVGMDSLTLAHVFEPFFTTKQEGRGTGLGLATTHGIVKEAHGCISVKSEVGQGSTFWIYLPLADSLPCPAHPEREAERADPRRARFSV